MISSSEFKKHISKELSGQLKKLGFKGSGFDYRQETENFIFVLGIQASQYGGQCCAEYAFHPKIIEDNRFKKIDLKKIKYYQCEFRARLHYPTKGDTWWKYSDKEHKNIEIAHEIVTLVKDIFLPVITLLSNTSCSLDNIEITDLDSMKKVAAKLNGMSPMTSDLRLAWVLTKYFEKTNLLKAKTFAEYALFKSESIPNFFGRPYLEKIIENSSTSN
jgi:hypothetical protein